MNLIWNIIISPFSLANYDLSKTQCIFIIDDFPRTQTCLFLHSELRKQRTSTVSGTKEKQSQCDQHYCLNKKYFNLKLPCSFELSVFIVETLSQQVRDAPSGAMVVPWPANPVWVQLPMKTLVALCLGDSVDRRHHCWHLIQTVSHWCKFAAVNHASGRPCQDQWGKWVVPDGAPQIKNGKTWGIYLKMVCFYYNSKHSATWYCGTPPCLFLGT